MTAEQSKSAGALSHLPDALSPQDTPCVWHNVDWQKAHQQVRRLQVRIVKATQQGRWNKVQALQHLLTHSFSGKVLAVRRVTENDGKKTAGVDGQTWDTPAQKAQGVQSLRQRGYQPHPLRRVYIPKSNGKRRPLGIPTMRDRAMQALYLLALDPLAETLADTHSYGFRKERNCADAIGQCYSVLAPKRSAQWILEGDIASCFDRIDHDWLLSHIPLPREILRKWLKAGYLHKQVFYETQAGTPQGGIISPVLANLTLDGLQKVLAEQFPKTQKSTRSGKVNLIRYADDFLISGCSKELLQEQVRPRVEEFLQQRGLQLSPEKTQITSMAEGFDFLGQNVRKYRGKLLIKPAKKSVATFLQKVREVVKANKQASAGQLILWLNPMLRGWANYHRHVVSKRVFAQVDHALFVLLWRWAKRRHPNKGRRWIKARYFGVPDNAWAFVGEVKGRRDRPCRVRLLEMARIPIVRHTLIRERVNPYDPAWEVYLEERLGLKMASTLGGRRQLRYLWWEQQGICPLCQQKITKVTGWHNHHILRRSQGGEDHSDNRVLLHPTCHRQVHSRNLFVAKPCPSRGIAKA